MKKLLRSITAIILTTVFFGPLLAWSGEDSSRVGRYLTVSNKPKPSQIDLLSQIVQVRFPQNVQTVGESVAYILRFSGYSLVAEDDMQIALKETLAKPLPLVDRELGPMSLKDGLMILIGTAFSMSHDPVHRTVNFKLKSQYAKLSARIK